MNDIPPTEIHVRDTGVRIATEHLAQIFNPFFRANEGQVRGTGLGLRFRKRLSICSRIAHC
ncbi:MAG: ATP-binding protein [Chloroflexota bacterium]